MPGSPPVRDRSPPGSRGLFSVPGSPVILGVDQRGTFRWSGRPRGSERTPPWPAGSAPPSRSSWPCRSRAPPPPAQPAKPFADGVVTPHASFLALPYAQHAAVDNLVRLERDFDSYGPGGFYDAVAVRSGTVARRYLALDQAMVLGPIGNALSHDDIRGYFSRGQVERAIRPLLARERFSAGRSAGTDR
ncbi:glucoamylase family protein [Actinopolymorpha singaporensis]|uniref:glucoamylase family protein n=1 Tax=Actinopolymorpha singaporensis TaxID=117157 RepID=UPI000B852E6A|nr:glucoamylase family protein [Actinopolymorpha singaporensis]